jgi:hypothetical protein
MQPCAVGSLDASPHLFERTTARHATELVRIKRIDADVDAVKTGFPERFGEFFQSQRIGCHGDVGDTGSALDFSHNLDNIRAQGRLAASVEFCETRLWQRHAPPAAIHRSSTTPGAA